MKHLNTLLVALFASAALCLTSAGSVSLSYADSVSDICSGDTFSASSIPAFTGEGVVTYNDNIPEFTQDHINNPVGGYSLSNFDELGRCQTAFGCICPDTLATEERGEIGMVKPTGWHTVKYDCIEDRYLYNRCHLLGFQLTGLNADERNLITGTRYMNVSEMLPYENEVASYVRDTGNHVLYRVTPVFEDLNLVASGVHMEAYSIEDEGTGVSFNVFCYNIQPGVGIDYASGDSWALENVDAVSGISTAVLSDEVHLVSASDVVSTDSSLEDDSVSSVSEGYYVLNTNTKKFHLPSCSSVSQMADHNKAFSEETRDVLISNGYAPCGSCQP